MPDETKIILSDEDAELYKEFCKHYRLFKYLLSQGVFTHRGGKVILHYSVDGKRLGIHREHRSASDFIFSVEDENNLTII